MVTALIVNPNSPELRSQSEQVQEAARALGWELHVINARSESEIDAAFGTAVLQRAGAVIVSADPFFLSRRDQIVALAAHYAVLVNPDSPNAEPDIEDARRAARVLGWQIAVVTATTEREFDVWPGFAPRAALQRTAAGTRFLLI